MSPRLEIESASFSYGDREIWKDINFEVRKGENLCLLGPNGCGKTTLLNCVHGDLRLKTGRIRLDNLSIRKLSVLDIARKMGYVFQEHSAPFPYTSLEVVRMGRAAHLGLFQTPSTEDTLLAKQLMDEMGIGHLCYQRYTKISGGERQLVLIARALCQQPEVLLFDEPTSHLDFKNQALVIKTIQRLTRKGLTIIMTSHFPNHAWSLSSRVALMNNGSIVALGSAKEIMTEENLSNTYGIKVKVYEALNSDESINFCTPEF